MPKCDFNKVATSASVFSCKIAADFQNIYGNLLMSYKTLPPLKAGLYDEIFLSQP